MPDEEKPSKEEYTWFEMGFFTHWDRSGQRRVLCIDTPGHFRSALHAIVTHSTLEPNDPFAMLKPLIDELLKLSDRSVWRVRNAVRDVEKVFQPLLMLSLSRV
jgi:hypothetical protein